jgi:hypothetical protein
MISPGTLPLWPGARGKGPLGRWELVDVAQRQNKRVAGFLAEAGILCSDDDPAYVSRGHYYVTNRCPASMRVVRCDSVSSVRRILRTLAEVRTGREIHVFAPRESGSAAARGVEEAARFKMRPMDATAV